MCVLGFVIENHGFCIFLVSKSVVFFMVFPIRFAGPFASIFACLATGDYADCTVKTNEKSTFLRFGLFHAFVKTCAFGVDFAYFSN